MKRWTPAEIRCKALRAAAAVAMTGCSQSVPAVGVAAADAKVAGEDAQVVDSAETTTDSTATTTPDTTTPDTTTPDTTDSQDVANALDDSDGRPQCKDLADNAKLAQCCDDLGKWCAAHESDVGQEASTCQFGPNFDGSTGCIPWGPPAPPEFEAA